MMHVPSSWSIVYAREASGPLVNPSFRKYPALRKAFTVAQCQRSVASALGMNNSYEST